MPSALQSRFAKPLAITLAVFAVYALLGFFAGPPIVKRVIDGFVADTLHRKASIGEVRVNPLLFTLEMKDFALSESDGAPIAGFRRLFADFELSSLARLAWTFSAIELEGFDLRADIAPGGRFNLVALLDSLPQSGPGDRPPRALLHRIVLSDGAITFSDRSLATPASTKFAPISLEVNDLSTLPDLRGGYTLSARLAGGGSVGWRGEASLQPLASQGELQVKGAKIANAWPFLRDRLDLTEPRGEFDVGARYRFAYAAGTTQASIEDLKISGRGLSLAANGAKEPLLAIASVEVAGGRADLAAREITVKSVEVRDGRSVLDVDAGGAVNLLKLVKPGAIAKPPAAAPGKPWKARLEALKVSGVDVEYTDHSRVTPIRVGAKQAALALSAAIEERPDGVQVLLEGIAVNLAGLSGGAADAASPLGSFDAFALEGGTLDLAQRRAGVGRIAISGGELRVVREKDGSLPLLKLLTPSDAGLLRREIGGALKEAKAEGQPWRLALEKLEVNGTRIGVSDHSFGAPVAYDVRDLRFALHGFASDGKAPLKFDAALRLEQGGSLSASGEARIAGDQVEMRAKLDRISLKPLQPAFATRARVKLASGDVSADVKVSYRQRDGKHGLRLGGSLRVDDFLINEADSGDRLLAWKAFTASGLSLGLAPDQLKIEEAKLEGLGAKIVVFQDRSVNLEKALTLDASDEGAKKPAVTLSDTKPLFPATVDRVRLQGGIVDFADLSLVLPFGAKVEEVSGLLEGVSTDRASRAKVKLEGRVGEFGLARAEGSLEPFHPADFMDLVVVFRNVDMPPLSPYTATFAGRRIASGRVSLDLHYKINKGQLAGDNRVVLEKFTLGERVESPSAINLPLDLAIALLTDSDGRIDLAVPVTGDVNDPQFSYGPIIWQAIRTVIGRIVSAPFRAIASLFGGGSGENLEAIAFDPGRAVLLPPEQEKLKHVAEGLAKRPQLRVVAEGQAGKADLAALQQRDVALAVAVRLERAPAPGAAPDPVNVGDAKTQRALEAVFSERQSDDALAKFAADTAKSRNKEVNRINAAQALIGRASPDREFYEALLKRLNETAQVPDAALAQLASERARAVTEHLTSALAVPAERATARAAKSTGEPQVKLELDAAAAK